MAVPNMVDILNQIADLHDQMIELSNKKKAAIVQNDIHTLKIITLKETEFIKQVEALEKLRISETGTNSTLLEMMEKCHHVEDKVILRNARARLVQSIAVLKQLNEINQQLLQEALLFIDCTFNSIIGSTDDENAIYRDPLKNGFAANRAGFLDLKV